MNWEPVWNSDTCKCSKKDTPISIWEKVDYSTGETFITRYPSESYCNDFIMGRNDGSLAFRWMIKNGKIIMKGNPYEVKYVLKK